MATKEQIETAIKVIKDHTSNPESGIIADLIRELELLKLPAQEVRIIETKEKR
jgi:hypothetical protein